MDQLSSCYFCGGALDVSLSEYPVVPKQLRAEPEDSKTVVLCPTCRHKLGAIVEDVVAAADEPRVEDPEQSTDEPSYEGTGFEPIDSEAADGEIDEGSLLNDETDTGNDPSADGDTTTATAARDDTEPAAEETAEAGDIGPTDDTDTSEIEDSSASSSETRDDSTDDSDPTLTRLEYNKVMRLLQNRELPVDRTEIREVATSAYDIDTDEFEAVIRAAVERGLIDEENGKFVDPS